MAGERFTLADSRPPIPGPSLTLPARKFWVSILYGVELGRREINILTEQGMRFSSSIDVKEKKKKMPDGTSSASYRSSTGFIGAVLLGDKRGSYVEFLRADARALDLKITHEAKDLEGI